MFPIVHVRPRFHIFSAYFSYMFGDCFLNIQFRQYETCFDVVVSPVFMSWHGLF